MRSEKGRALNAREQVVLVADTDPDVRALLMELLREWNLRGAEAGNLSELLGGLSRTDFALAVVEYLGPAHPHREGWPALEVLRAVAPKTPVVALYGDGPPPRWPGLVGALPLPVDVDALRRLIQQHLRRPTPARAQKPYLAAYLQSLWEGDMEAANRVVDEAASAGMATPAIFEELLTAALHQFGDWWGSGACRTADEHGATAITRQVMARMVGQATPLPPLGPTAVLACPPAERHDVAIEMVAHLMRLDGWRARLLGAETPIQDLLAYAQRYNPELIGISVTMPYDHASLRQVVVLLKEVSRARVIVGGQAVVGPDEARALGCDGYVSKAADAPALARTLLSPLP